MKNRALILIDLQNDFVEGGALAVPGGKAVIEVANRIMPLFDVVIATQDWHPANHQSFVSQHPGLQVGDLFDLNGLPQIAWPDHCVQRSEGAALVPTLNAGHIDHVVRKGENRSIDSYSGFFDNGHAQETGLHALLQRLSITELYVMGLATDFCVKYTVIDALQIGYSVRLIRDGCRGVELRPGDVAKALSEMQNLGAEIVESLEIPPRI